MEFEDNKPQEGQDVEQQEIQIKTPEEVLESMQALSEHKGNEMAEYKNNENGTGHAGVKNEFGYLSEANYKLKNPENPDEGYDYYYEKSYGQNEDGQRTSENGSDMLPEKEGNTWDKSIVPGEHGPMEEHGKITQGPDKGHEWKKKYEYLKSELVPNINIRVESGEIVSRGENEKKEATGHTWSKVSK